MGGIATPGRSHGCYVKKVSRGSNSLTRASTHVCTRLHTCKRAHTRTPVLIHRTHSPIPICAHGHTCMLMHSLGARAYTGAGVHTPSPAHMHSGVTHIDTHVCTHPCTRLHLPSTCTFTETHLCVHTVILYIHTHVYTRGCSVHTHPTLRHTHARFREQPRPCTANSIQEE